MFDYKQYKKNYFMPPVECMDWVKKDSVSKAPIWCSVDLRDGNQALIEPMSLEEKLEFFKMLVKIGFKEIEVGFPAASDTEYQLVRTLIEENLIPEDVTIQVLTQAREHIIRKTFEAVKGASKVVVHLYNSTSVAQREQVFKKSKEEILNIAVEGAKLLKQLASETDGNFSFEYSPESFTGTEMEYAAEVCNHVIDVWEPTPDHKVIINLPSTVEESMPHVYASQIEYMHKNLHRRDSVIISLHPHNDRGCGVSDAELGMLAGADRIEGTLFGNGERTGNADIVILAMNLFSIGVDPVLDLSNLPEIVEMYERLTQMTVHERHPYCGKLVFAAFSGSHQDAIAKGMKYREDQQQQYWTVPYLPINPEDVGRKYDADVIRINSQSGKGGVSYVLEKIFGIKIPAKMREDVGYAMKAVSDAEHKELSPEKMIRIFEERYKNHMPVFTISDCRFEQEKGSVGTVVVIIESNGIQKEIKASGNGHLDAVSKAFGKEYRIPCEIICYEEHALQDGSDSHAIAYVGIKASDGSRHFGVGVDPDIIRASVNALAVAVNRSIEKNI